MPALVADIAAATAPGGRTLVEAADPGLKAGTPNARDGAGAPVPGWFDAEADAQDVVDARFAMVGQPRRRFLLRVSGLRFDLLPDATAKMVTFEDAEHAAAGAFFVSRVQIDLDQGVSVLELFG